MGATAHLQSFWELGGSAVLDSGEAEVISSPLTEHSVSRLNRKGLEGCEIWCVLAFEISFYCVLGLLYFVGFYA